MITKYEIGDRIVATKTKIMSGIMINRGERMTVLEVSYDKSYTCRVEFDTPHIALDTIIHEWWIEDDHTDLVKKYKIGIYEL